jgi:hypothetical protein
LYSKCPPGASTYGNPRHIKRYQKMAWFALLLSVIYDKIVYSVAQPFSNTQEEK